MSVCEDVEFQHLLIFEVIFCFELKNLRLVRREERMGTSLGRSNIERWEMSACTKFSSAWILSPPDHFGFIKNNLFREVFATHLGQALPAIHSYVGGFFGKRGERVIINQPIVQYSFNHDGTVPKSTTCEMTIELEDLRLVRLEERMGMSLGRSDIERWAVSACTKFSSAWILSPPDHFGFIENSLSQEVFATHLGQASPAIHSYVGGFFGKRGERVDTYGANTSRKRLFLMNPK